MILTNIEMQGGSLEEAMRYAIFASAVYEKPENRKDYLRKYNKEQHFIVPKYSTDEVMTTKHVKTKELIVAIRGSATVKDWVITDWALAKNMIESTSRYKDNYNLLQKLLQSNVAKTASKIILTGHSLGSTIILNLGRAFNIKSIGFNRGSTPLEFIFQKLNSNHKDYLTDAFDPVSYSAKKLSKDKKELIPKRVPSKNPHSISQFLPLNQREIQQTGNSVLIEKEYYNRKTGLIGVDALHKKLMKKDKNIKKKDVKEFLESQATYQIHYGKPSKRRFVPTFSNNLNSFQVDLTFPQFTTKTSPKYIITFININSRKVYAYNGRKRTAKELVQYFDKFYKDVDGKVETLTSDNEFAVPKLLQKWLKDKNIVHFIVQPYDKRSLGILNRFHRTLKARFDKYFTAYNTTKWWEATDDIISNYNNTYHTGIRATPNNITKQQMLENLKMTKNKVSQTLNQLPNFEIGMKVRTLLPKETFEKGEKVYSDEIFYIANISPMKTVQLITEKGKLKNKMYKPDEILVVKKLSKDSNRSRKRLQNARESARNERALRDEGVDIENIIALRPRSKRNDPTKKLLKENVRKLMANGNYVDGKVQSYNKDTTKFRLAWKDNTIDDATIDEVNFYINQYNNRIGKKSNMKSRKKFDPQSLIGKIIEREYDLVDKNNKKVGKQKYIGKVIEYNKRRKREYKVDFGKEGEKAGSRYDYFRATTLKAILKQK